MLILPSPRLLRRRTGEHHYPPDRQLSTARHADNHAGWQERSTTPNGRPSAGRCPDGLVRPSRPGYLSDLQLYDSRFDSVRPMGIAYCASVTDVQRSLSFAREHDLPFAARSGGHSYAGYSTSTGLIIDVTQMAAVHLSSPSDPGGSVTVGAGTRLIDVYSALNGAGVSIPAGSCPTVGIAGLALGGGVGVVDRAYGLTCDAVQSVQVVTADSQVVTASSTTNPDLYWACRGGGGGNFGIATSFTLQTFPTVPLTLVFLTWPWAAASRCFRPGWHGRRSTRPAVVELPARGRAIGRLAGASGRRGLAGWPRRDRRPAVVSDLGGRSPAFIPLQRDRPVLATPCTSRGAAPRSARLPAICRPRIRRARSPASRAWPSRATWTAPSTTPASRR